MLGRLPIRARLAAAFAVALLLVLALAGVFVYLRVSSELTSALDDELERRATELAVLAQGDRSPDATLPAPGEGDEGFSQILDPSGEVIASSGPESEEPGVDEATLDRASRGTVIAERPVEGVEDEARIFAVPVGTRQGERIVVAAGTTEDRSEALAGIAGAFAIGIPVALVLASGLGYLLAARALAPVESMRRRASGITLERSGDRLPLPTAEDELRRLAETLNTMLDRIESSLERERVFVADASHELRTPLAVLRAELELAARPGRSPEELRAAISSAAEETDRLSRLAEDLLVIARSDQGRLPIQPERVDVAELLGRVHERFSTTARAHGREITVDAPEGLAADLDRLRMEQALGNLVDNALRHGAGLVRLSATRDDGRVVLDVADRGPGFPAGFESIAFERFTRGAEGRTGGGSGLGLAIVHAIARAHGGSAVVESADGAGALVRISLPVRQSSSSTSAEAGA
jgi:two-component system OmpR family sensor kinase